MEHLPAAGFCDARQSATCIDDSGKSNGGENLEIGEAIRIGLGQVNVVCYSKLIEEQAFADSVWIRGEGRSCELPRSTFQTSTDDGVGLEMRAQRRDQKIRASGEDDEKMVR